MKRFMYFSIGVLCLAIAALVGFHLGARTAEAQAPAPVVGTFASGPHHFVFLENGDVWQRTATDVGGPIQGGWYYPGNLIYVGNLWAGGPVPAAPGTLGGVKSKYR